MDTVTDMDMLMVTHMEVMNMEDRVSPGTVFLKATLPTFGSHFKVLKWETTLVRIHWQIFVLRLHQFLSSRTERSSKEKQSSEEEEKEVGAGWSQMRRGRSTRLKDGPADPATPEDKSGSDLHALG